MQMDKSTLQSAVEAYKQNQDFPALTAFLKSYFHIESIDERIFPYLKGEGDLDGYFLLMPFEKCYQEHYSFRHLFKDFSDRPFPAICIGGDGDGVDFYMLLETGKIITLHHDATFYEVACSIRTEDEKDFLRRFEAQGSSFHYQQMRSLQALTAHLDSSDFDFGEQLFQATARSLSLSLRQTADIMFHESMVFVSKHFGDLWEFDDALEEFLDANEPKN
jgi:hypothetical protein